MNQYKVRAIRMGCMFLKAHIIRNIDVPGIDARDAMKKAERRLGANWGVVSAVQSSPAK